jgi:hypothetical protein
MLRWYMAVASLLGIMTSSLFSIAWSRHLEALRVEDLRQARVQRQILEQQAELLQLPGTAATLSRLHEDLDALQLRLIEILSQQTAPAGVLDIGYAQTILPAIPLGGHDATATIVRLDLSLVLQHSVALLGLLALLDEPVPAWPHETRACELSRLPAETLSAQCVVDFYHWDVYPRTISQAGSDPGESGHSGSSARKGSQ